MRKIREVLRLQAEGFSEREIARSVGCARSSVQICLWRAKQAGVAWPLSPEQDEAKLEALLYPRRLSISIICVNYFSNFRQRAALAAVLD